MLPTLQRLHDFITGTISHPGRLVSTAVGLAIGAMYYLRCIHPDMRIYQVVAGRGQGSSGVTTRYEFARWTRYEIGRKGKYWQHAD